MKEYVLGFLFSTTENVWLIRKNRNDWQKGLLNGIGGKIELNESSVDAMKREFREEAGLVIDDWKYYATITDDKNYKVCCYYSYSDESAITMTDEQVGCYPYKSLPSDIIPNINWLIPMALSFSKGEKSYGFSVKEMYKVD